jgi:hypothetical protein
MQPCLLPPIGTATQMHPKLKNGEVRAKKNFAGDLPLKIASAPTQNYENLLPSIRKVSRLVTDRVLL